MTFILLNFLATQEGNFNVSLLGRHVRVFHTFVRLLRFPNLL